MMKISRLRVRSMMVGAALGMLAGVMSAQGATPP